VNVFGSRPAVFEVTVEGRLGPVFRSALHPCHVAESRLCTILVTRGKPRRDIAELVRLLEDRGVRVQDVIVHDATDD
jgi:hypothetical protein